jgi:hypothetical protein
MQNPPISASLAGSASSGAGLSGNFSRIFGDKIIGKKQQWWVFAIVGGIILLLGLVWLQNRKEK